MSQFLRLAHELSRLHTTVSCLNVIARANRIPFYFDADKVHRLSDDFCHDMFKVNADIETTIACFKWSCDEVLVKPTLIQKLISLAPIEADGLSVRIRTDGLVSNLRSFLQITQPQANLLSRILSAGMQGYQEHFESTA